MPDPKSEQLDPHLLDDFRRGSGISAVGEPVRDQEESPGSIRSAAELKKDKFYKAATLGSR